MRGARRGATLAALCAVVPPIAACQERGDELRQQNAIRQANGPDAGLVDAGAERDAGADAAALCQAGEWICEGPMLQRCNGGGRGWETVAVCITAALCELGQGETCANGCTPGETRCAGSQLQACSDDATGYVTLEDCGAPQRCDPGGAACLPPAEDAGP